MAGMTRSLPAVVAVATALLLATVSATARADDPKAPGEKEKIEALIKAVEQMTDAKFVRNGTAYDGKAAADHMRRKWKKVEKDVRTARDFIRLAGTKSYETGEVYRVRFKDGREVESAKWLTERLEEIEKRQGDKVRG
jgi:uncharacterized membrane protein